MSTRRSFLRFLGLSAVAAPVVAKAAAERKWPEGMALSDVNAPARRVGACADHTHTITAYEERPGEFQWQEYRTKTGSGIVNLTT